jgi:ABC-2 type transport system permease protein
VASSGKNAAGADWAPDAVERFARLSRTGWSARERKVGGISVTMRSLREVFAHREVLSLLIRRDLKARYKDSALGMFWVLVKPLVQLALYFVAIGLFLGASRGIPNFAIYIFTGLTIYGLFSEIVSGGTQSIVMNGGLIKKVYLPREIFPIASTGSALINSGIQFALLIVASILSGAFNYSTEALFIVPSVLIIIIYALALGILLSAVNVYLRDMQYLIEVFLMIFMWASPIIYSWGMVAKIIGPGVLLEVYTDNPITLAVLGMQRGFWHGTEVTAYPDMMLLRMGIALVVGLILLVVCQRAFNRLEGDFAQSL